MALCLDRQGRLLVADGGSAQQVRIYDVHGLRPHLVRTLGTRGGIVGGQGKQIGQAGPLRFNHLTGVGCDAQGNVYVASNGSVAGGGTVMECYAPSGRRLWRLLGLEFIDCAEPDPASDTDVYTKEEHFVMDYARPAGQQWTYQGYTVNRFKYPDDPRLHTGRDLGLCPAHRGQAFLFTTDMYSGELAVFRFQPGTDGETRDPLRPVCQRPFHRRQDGMAAGPAGQGRMALAGQRRQRPIPFGRVRPAGNGQRCAEPVGLERGQPGRCLAGDGPRGPARVSLCSAWTPTAARSIPMPRLKTTADARAVCRTVPGRIPARDRHDVSGRLHDGAPPHRRRVGHRGNRGDPLRPLEPGQSQPALRIVLPYDGKKDPQVYIKAMCCRGEYVFAVESRDPERVFVYDARTGAFQGTMQPDETVGKSSGWVDTPYGIRAARRANGEYLIFVEEDLDAKVILYRWTPPK